MKAQNRPLTLLRKLRIIMKKPKKATHLDIWGSYWKINKHGFSFHDGKMWILCSNNRIWRDHLKNGNIFEV